MIFILLGVFAIACQVASQSPREMETQALLQSTFNRRKEEAQPDGHNQEWVGKQFCDDTLDSGFPIMGNELYITAEATDAQYPSHMPDNDDAKFVDKCRIGLLLLTFLVCSRGIWRWRETKNQVTVSDLNESELNDTFCEADSWGVTPLHRAAQAGCMEDVVALLKRGVETNPEDVCNETPLHLAARHGHTEVCDVLCEHGADVNALNIRRLTPLVVAGQSGHETICQALIEFGGDFNDFALEDLPIMLQDLLSSPMALDSDASGDDLDTGHLNHSS